MKGVYVVRYGAYGDHIHMSNVLRAFAEDGWEITFEYNWKGYQIHRYNPLVTHHVPFEPVYKSEIDKLNLGRRLESIKKHYDRFVTFTQSLEDSLICHENTPEYFYPLWMRRKKNAHICYYDQSMRWAGLTDKRYMGRRGEIYFPRHEHEHVKNFLKQYEDKFIVLWAIRGSMWQKAMYPIAPDICNEFLSAHPDAVIFTTGDEFCKQWEWEHPRVFHKSGVWPFRQALLTARYSDLIVTPETGLGIGAGAYSRPKIMMLTAASLKNAVGNDVNDYSLQSDAYCSPCTRAIYDTMSCPVNEKTKLPICVDFNKDRVLARMDEVYRAKHPRNWAEGEISIVEGKEVWM